MADDVPNGAPQPPASFEAPCLLLKPGSDPNSVGVEDVLRMEPTLRAAATGVTVVVFTAHQALVRFLDWREKRDELRAQPVQYASPEELARMLCRLRDAGVSHVAVDPPPGAAIFKPIDDIIARFRAGPGG